MKQRTRLTASQKSAILDYYNDGLNGFNISKKLKIDSSSVYYLLKKNNLYKPHSKPKNYRKYSVNDNFFDIIDSEEKAYFLGLMYADGHNYSDRNEISLGLQKSDKHILDTFNNLIQNNKPLYKISLSHQNKNYSDQFRIAISSKQLSSSLNNLGCVQSKSLILKFPKEDQIPNHLIRHMIRGYFDGDGCVCFEPKNKNIRLQILGTKDFVTHIRQHFLDNFPDIKISSGVRLIKNKLCSWSLNGNLLPRLFFTWIYEDSNPSLRLKRKYEKFLIYSKILETKKFKQTTVGDLYYPYISQFNK